jgi:aspartate aminotransferase
MSRLGTETAFEVLVRARALEAKGKDIVHLEIGEPDFDTPRNIIDAGADALRSGWTHYGPSAGLPDLRDCIAQYLNRSRGTSYMAENIIVTPGGKPIMFFVILALLEPGDEAIYPNPGFPIYESMINFTGATAVPSPIREEKDFALDVDELESLITPRTKLLIINSPGNPTSGVLSRTDIERIAELAVKHDLTVLSDEIYSEIIYEGEHVSIATMPGMVERTIVLDGFSKTYAMTGWRLGWAIAEERLLATINKMLEPLISCPSSVSQQAGIAALRGTQQPVAVMRNAYCKRRDIAVEILEPAGMLPVRPKGAFYAIADLRETGMRGKELALAVLEEKRVATAPGDAFGAVLADGYLRLSLASSDEAVAEGCRRLIAFRDERRG